MIQRVAVIGAGVALTAAATLSTAAASSYVEVRHGDDHAYVIGNHPNTLIIFDSERDGHSVTGYAQYWHPVLKEWRTASATTGRGKNPVEADGGYRISKIKICENSSPRDCSAWKSV